MLDGGRGFFKKFLAKKNGLTKETHATSASETSSGSRQTQLGGWTIQISGGDMPRNKIINEFSKYIVMRCHLIMVKARLMSIPIEKLSTSI